MHNNRNTWPPFVVFPPFLSLKKPLLNPHFDLNSGDLTIFFLILFHSFDFCPSLADGSPAENLGQVVFGERIRASPYEIKFNQNGGKCKTVCSKNYDSSKKEDQAKLDFLKKGMAMNYQHHWIVDNMPVTWCYQVLATQGTAQ